jgi:ornithine decarboxylase
MIADKQDKVVELGRGRRGPSAGTFRDTAEVIRKLAPAQPAYCWSRHAVQSQVHRFLEGFPGECAYAVKANAERVIVKAVADAGLRWFDVASMSEIALIRDIAPEATLLYDNPVRSRAEIEEAYRDFGVRSFALDDVVEFEKLRSIIGDDPTVQLTVRFKLPRKSASQDLSSKFGAVREDAIALLRRVSQAGYQAALTFHPGSQCRETAAYVDHIQAAAEIAEAAGVRAGMINVGGGFPVPYLNSHVPPLEDYFLAIDRAWRAHFDTSLWHLCCEPGRGLIAPTASLLTRVKHRRSGNVIFLNDGIYGGLMEQYMYKVAMPVRAFRGSEPLGGGTEEFTVFGPTCDSTDCLPLRQTLPAAVAEGDWIEFGLMGAYGSATATRFNGFSSEQYVEVEEVFRTADA